MDRYKKNFNMLSEAEQLKLRQSKVCVVGCGGLGGYIIEMLARLGIGNLTVIDGDRFDLSNLNRQLNANEDNIGLSKALEAQKRVNHINSEVNVRAIAGFINEKNAKGILEEHDVIVDALDSIEMRFIIEKTCESLNIPLVYGAIAGWYGQVATILPGDHLLSKIYPNHPEQTKGSEVELGNPSFTPALIASIQVSEVLKLLIGRGELLRNKLLLIDLLNQDIEYIKLDK
jgi:Dinucleotide-utilizing enzymes involved in molybdopterin and thiamine biosynthesis family 2